MVALKNERTTRLRLAVGLPLALATGGWPTGARRSSGAKISTSVQPEEPLFRFSTRRLAFLSSASANTARAFANVHEIDASSATSRGAFWSVKMRSYGFRIAIAFSSSLARAICAAGIDTFTPPELQGRPLERLARTENHDDFGLAVPIFLMPFMGRHPFFAGSRPWKAGDPQIPQANKLSLGSLIASDLK